MKKDIIWIRLPAVLGKWSRNEELTKEDQETLIAAQNEDINRYCRMRKENRDYQQMSWMFLTYL